MTYLVITTVGPGGEETSIATSAGTRGEGLPTILGVLARRAEQGPCWPVARVAVYADLSQPPVQEYEIEVPGARGGQP